MPCSLSIFLPIPPNDSEKKIVLILSFTSLNKYLLTQKDLHFVKKPGHTCTILY